MSIRPFRTQAHHLPELSADDTARPSPLDPGRFDLEADFAEEHAREALAAEMAAAPSPVAGDDPDAARLIAEHAAQQRERSANEDHHAPTDEELAASDDFHAMCDAFTEGFVDWLSRQTECPTDALVCGAGVAA